MAQLSRARISDTEASVHTFSEFTGIQYLQIDIATNFGLDKEDWNERILWTETRDSFLEDLVKEAEEPALYYAGVQAYRRAQKGLPIGYPISLDATSSGLQLLACLTGCEASANLCNVIPTGHRQDAYTALYKLMCEAVGDRAKLTREQVKQSIMTSLYGSTAQPKKHFGTGELLDVFYKTMQTYAPGAWSLNKGLINLWQPGALSHDWVLPDNFHVHVPVMTGQTEFVHFLNTPVAIHTKVNQGTDEGLSLSANVIHSLDGMVVREIHRRCDYDADHMIELIETIMKENFGIGARSTVRDQDQLVLKLWAHYEESGFLSARILELLDEHNIGLVDYSVIKAMIKTLPDKPFKVISVHDCFRCLPSYGNDLRRQYNQILSDIAGSDMLAFIVSRITGAPAQVTKAGDISQQILSADYALA